MMKKYYICIVLSLIMLVCPIISHAQSPNENYIVSETMLNANGTNSIKSVQYYDGLGRPNVLVAGGANSSGKYLYSMTEYDQMGRESRTWLPAVGPTTPDIVDVNAMNSLSSNTYDSDGYALSEIQYDALGRQTFKTTPGQEWNDHSKGITTEYITNEVNSVKKYALDSSGNPIAGSGYYPPSSLTGERTTDEDGISIETYKDLLGNVVLERRAGNNDTYYVYESGLLKTVIPPQYQLQNDTTLLYKYGYDAKGRCIWKRLPGCDPERYWYDRYGRLAFMQNARFGIHNYRFFLYDGLGRLALQGTCIGTSSGDYEAKVIFDSTQSGIDNTGYCLCGSESLRHPAVEIANYYDGYDFLSLQSVQNVLNGQNFTKSNPSCATTLQTGSLTATSDGHFLCNVFYYDEKGQLIDSRQTLLNGTVMTDITTYSFTGQPVQTVTSLRMGYMTPTVTETYTYDSKSDKLRSATLSFGNGAIPVSGITYDDLGRVQTKDYHGGSIRTSYSYDLHGWLTGLTATKANGSRLFQEDIHYADNSATNCYNGNISMVRWLSGDNPMGQNICNGYTYTYDGMNRLTGASFGMGNIGQPGLSTFNDMGTVQYTYNANSSLTGMTRYGRKDVGYGVIDNLMYSYNGNQLNDIYDAVSNQHYDGAFEFWNNAVPVPLGAPEYGYDGCGAMTYDLNRGIVKIDYDLLGNPKRIQFSNGNVTEYVYSADGRRLQTTHRTAVSGISVGIGQEHTLTSQETLSTGTTYYMDKFLYSSNGTLRYYFADGYADGNGASYFHYYIRDHQGNNRVVAKYDGTIEQTTHYYPYGGILSQSTNQGVQKYKYSGKEFDRMHGLNMYDYGARQQDPAVGMFTSMDPLCEKYYNISPYIYCAGNPVRYVDVDGKFIANIVGGLVGCAVEIGIQMLVEKKSFSDINWGNVGLETVSGAITCGSSTIKTIAVKTGVAVAKSAIEHKGYDIKAIATDATINLIGDVIGGGIAKGAASTTKAVSKTALKPISTMSKRNVTNSIKEISQNNISTKTARKIAVKTHDLSKEIPKKVKNTIESDPVKSVSSGIIINQYRENKLPQQN